VAVGRCDALHTPRVLGPFLEVAAALDLATAVDRDSLLATLLDALRDGEPTLVVIEDAHWADDTTIELIAMLGRRAVDLPLVQFFGCVHEPLSGSMGIHFVNGSLAGDTEVDPRKPEALMYEVKPGGKLELIGVEYVVFKADWDAANPAPPELFGQEFNVVEEPNRYGIPTFYELHAWAWKPNPTGAHKDWNPTVLCPGTEGHTH
jgi:hypothetical protein